MATTTECDQNDCEGPYMAQEVETTGGIFGRTYGIMSLVWSDKREKY